MGLLDRFSVAGPPRGPARTSEISRRVDSHTPGVEAYVEPKTTVTDVTVVLVAADGEWTRRRIVGERGASGSPAI